MFKAVFLTVLMMLASIKARSEVIYGISNTFALGGSTRAMHAAPFPAPGMEVFPNPFTPAVTVRIRGLKAGDRPVLQIYDVKGALVSKASDKELLAGRFIWKARNRAGAPVSCGFYILKLTFRGQSLFRRILYIQ